MANASSDHVKDIGKNGIKSHTGSDGRDYMDRIAKYGKITGGSSSESIVYSENTGKNIVLKMLIDDGSVQKERRSNVFSSDFNLMGS